MKYKIGQTILFSSAQIQKTDIHHTIRYKSVHFYNDTHVEIIQTDIV